MQEKDHNGREYKCGPNWLPRWVFDEPLFYECCKQHDKDWYNGEGKWRSDVRLLKCTLEVANQEPNFWWRFRDKAQAYIMFFVLTTNPISYLYYHFSKKK